MARIFSRQRELAADAGAAALTGAPSTLAAALMRLTGELERIPRRDLREVRSGNLFYAIPTGEQNPLFATHPPLALRVRRLEEMERQLQAARPVLGEDG